MLALIKHALLEECGVEPDGVGLQTHLLKDLDIDSLDLLNASFRIEKDCGVKLPFRIWMDLEYGETPVEPSPFVVAEICRYLDNPQPPAGSPLKVAL